jgi:hypothetical protein
MSRCHGTSPILSTWVKKKANQSPRRSLSKPLYISGISFFLNFDEYWCSTRVVFLSSPWHSLDNLPSLDIIATVIQGSALIDIPTLRGSDNGIKTSKPTTELTTLGIALRRNGRINSLVRQQAPLDRERWILCGTPERYQLSCC